MRPTSVCLLILLLFLPAVAAPGAELRQCRNTTGQTLLTDEPACPAGYREAAVHRVQDLDDDRHRPDGQTDVQQEQLRALSIYDSAADRRSGARAYSAGGSTPRSERNAVDRQECQSLLAARESVQRRMRAGYTAAEGNALHERLRRIEAQQCALDCVYC
jgi:hypothetical protein